MVAHEQQMPKHPTTYTREPMTKEKESVGRVFDCSSQETATKSCNPVPEYTGIGKKKWCRMVASPER